MTPKIYFIVNQFSMNSLCGRSTLWDVLSNHLILRQIAPYIPVVSLLSLASTSKFYQKLVYDTPGVFSYLDLSRIREVDNPLCEGFSYQENLARCYAEGPFRQIFAFLDSKGVLQDVKTLILDTLNVEALVVHEVLCARTKSCSYEPHIGMSMLDSVPRNVRILSIRDCQNIPHQRMWILIEEFLRHVDLNDPNRVQAIYYHGVKDPLTPDGVRIRGSCNGNSKEADTVASANYARGGVTANLGAQLGTQYYHSSSLTGGQDRFPDPDEWYRTGRTVPTDYSETPSMRSVLEAARGKIYFDAVPCPAPRHIQNVPGLDVTMLRKPIATYAIGPVGCVECGTMPEGPRMLEGWNGETVHQNRHGNQSGHRSGKKAPHPDLPLLSPPPLHTTSIWAAQQILGSDGQSTVGMPFHARCALCLLDRWCERCHRFWCEDCLSPEAIAFGVGSIKVHFGLCVEQCLVGEMYSGSGEGGMWG
ncbi:hypothetical protein MMC25_004425 [Agyrium rufum]|nr:hypothetical protein [Agyrium rufum]